MLKVTQSVQTAVGDYGKLSMEVIRNGEDISVTIRPKGGVGDAVTGTVRPLKFHFLNIGEMQDLSACLTDAISFLGGK